MCVQLCPPLCDPTGCNPSKLLSCPWNSPGKNTGMICHFLLQGIFPTQESNPCLLHLLCWQADSLTLALVAHAKVTEGGSLLLALPLDVPPWHVDTQGQIIFYCRMFSSITELCSPGATSNPPPRIVITKNINKPHQMFSGEQNYLLKNHCSRATQPLKRSILTPVPITVTA